MLFTSPRSVARPLSLLLLLLRLSLLVTLLRLRLVVVVSPGTWPCDYRWLL